MDPVATLPLGTRSGALGRHGGSGSSCSAFPATDAFFHPPIGYVGSSATVAGSTTRASFAGDCPSTISTELSPWHRYRVGSG